MARARIHPRTLVSAALALSLAAGMPAPAEAQPSAPAAEQGWQEANRLRAEAIARMNAGDHDAAALLFERSLAVSERLAEPIRTDYVVIALKMLVMPYARRRDYTRVEGCYRRIAEEVEKSKGPNDPSLGWALDDLGQFYTASGEYSRAEAPFLRALKIYEGAGPIHATSVGRVMSNLASFYVAKGEVGRAEPLLEKAVAITEKALGPDHPGVAASLSTQAAVQHQKGDLTKARALYERACTIYDKVGGPFVHDAASCARGLGAVLQSQGDYAKAAPQYERARATWEKLLGPSHPHVARALNAMTQLAEARGDIPGAVATLTRAADFNDEDLQILLAVGSEGQKLDFLKRLADQTEGTLSLQTGSARSDPAALRLALRTVLRRKGAVLDAMGGGLSAIRKRADPEDGKLLDELHKVRSDLAALALGTGGGSAPPGAPPPSPEARATRMAGLQKEIDRIETAVSARSAEYRASSQPVSVERVAAAIPEGAALVELAVYRPYNPRWKKADEKWSPERYVAYVLAKSGEPAWTDLGPAAPIDEMVGELRKALANPDADAKKPARALDEKVGRPIRAILPKGTTMVLLSPDGALNLVPFGALVDEGGHYLIEKLAFTYLSSGRDLLRLQVETPAKGAPVVIANPAFDAGPAQPKVVTTPFSKAVFTPLPGTAEEAAAIAKLLPSAEIRVADQATEGALKGVRAPRVLHVATHGFFLSERATATSGARALVLEDAPAAPPAAGPPGAAGAPQAASLPGRPLSQESALIRSGLALAGANKHVSGNDDGVLTALEASGLNLWGTKLVVLSACETGVGEIRNGDGVHGLRRALVNAGAEAQIMSLWKVDDEATRDLMIDFYKRLVAGEGRSEALRQAQRGLLGRASHKHPYFWASFIPSGDWRGVTFDPVSAPASRSAGAAAPGKAAAAEVPKVEPGARGCGCEVAPQGGGAGWIGLLLGAFAAAVGRRRKRG